MTNLIEYDKYNIENEREGNCMIEFDEEQFLKTYRGSEKFVTDAKPYYELFLKLLKDEELLGHIKFANDYLKEPPLKSFIYYCRENNVTKLFDIKLKPHVNQGLVACFGYLYRVIYNEHYTPKQCLVNDGKSGIKTISRFEKYN